MTTTTKISLAVAFVLGALIALNGTMEPHDYQEIRYELVNYYGEEIADKMKIEATELSSYIDDTPAYCGTIKYKKVDEKFAAYRNKGKMEVSIEDGTMNGYYALCEPESERGKTERQVVKSIIKLNEVTAKLVKILDQEDAEDK